MKVPISRASKELGVSIDTLRHWEREGKINSDRTPGESQALRFRCACTSLSICLATFWMLFSILFFICHIIMANNASTYGTYMLYYTYG